MRLPERTLVAQDKRECVPLHGAKPAIHTSVRSAAARGTHNSSYFSFGNKLNFC